MTFTNQQAFALLLIAVGAFYVLSKKASDAIEAINPANENNIFNNAAVGLGEAVTGNPEATQNAFHHLFGVLDLINPFVTDERKEYARDIWNIN